MIDGIVKDLYLSVKCFDGVIKDDDGGRVAVVEGAKYSVGDGDGKGRGGRG